MFGPSGLTVAVEKKDCDDLSGWDTPGTREKVTVSQLCFYVGIKAVTDIVIIYRICFLQKSRRKVGLFDYKEKTSQAFPYNPLSHDSSH